MKDKSKIVAFMLSFIPGLAHLYIGLKERALIFFIFLVVGVTGGIGLAIITYAEVFLVLTIIGYLLLWLIALIDVFSSWKYIEIKQLYNSAEKLEIPDKTLNKKSISLALSVIPGAGHMYLGYQKKGLIIMGSFFFSIFFMGWLGVSMLLFLLPLIWFYSFFDAMHIAEGSQEEMKDQVLLLPNIKPEWIGFALIGIGVLIIMERVLYPLIDYEIRRYIQTTVVSLIFILVGIYMLMKNKKSSSSYDETEEENNDED
ncbi:hypothetical protein [Sedimentibacter sp. MB31-C6]|uniref:hypothetical protein n=1 Tax=Sedimentibacter sp. MB31-C6 TaxID=3109366 RepID=UPI002DDDB363|nr:hypothetical protein [Sedimentibacter sp. MB36-C1]WSI04563.1 hypothetical protein U8307_01910 [Sedimentibacter sp. MB36-C1]